MNESNESGDSYFKRNNFSFVKKFDRLLFSKFILCHIFCIDFSKNISSVFDLFSW